MLRQDVYEDVFEIQIQVNTINCQAKEKKIEKSDSKDMNLVHAIC